MKKQLLYLIIGLALFSFPHHNLAQEPDSETQYTNEERIDMLCGCVNSLMTDLHPQIKEMVREMDALGEEKAMENFTKYLEENPGEIEQIMKDGKTLEQFDQSLAEIDGCSNLNKILSDANLEDNPLAENEFKELLETKGNCEFAQIFFKMGTKE
ncbi:hypothetical protein J1N09_06170 [Aureitalea sp. L0-47]|uniref:hypothetical protein n=1 Tax=Aureitalea sp. L0-47 TaxID=2816962 RepID=UPI002237D082|nr:hypothetical protein [Aureitalea sp. L0-47]MCW5519414.1 hypothetical protein [Aureitalea sp. L0-47]